MILITFQCFMDAKSLSKSKYAVLLDRKIMHTGSQTWNTDFVETGFTGRMDFAVVYYSATNNDLPSNNRFSFLGKVSEVTCTWRSIYNVFAQVSLRNR
jgi:hypothetical protein